MIPEVAAAIGRLRATLDAETEPRAGGIGVSKRDLRTVLAAVDAVLALHRDAGPGMGHDTPGGDYYGDFPTSCTSCGTADEYAVTWPCPTVQALGVTPP